MFMLTKVFEFEQGCPSADNLNTFQAAYFKKNIILETTKIAQK